MGSLPLVRAGILLALLAGAAGFPAHAGKGGGPVHERLRFRNNFKKPEQVVNYYCGRDASGFVWSGLLDIERRAFTLWNQVPEHDSFYVATGFEVLPARPDTQRKDVALVQVRYDLKSVGDAHGTRAPAAAKERLVTFHLRKVSGTWKIFHPLPENLPPVVVESKFPY